jgi:adenosylmethionine-8-amino-7-oxononanoate aminotransferase
MSDTLLERDARRIWHPYTQHQNAEPFLPIASGSGAYLYDTEGRPYLDMIASWWVNLHGHGCEAIAEAIGRQARKLDHVHFAGVTHEPAVLLAEALTERSGLGEATRVFLSDNGSTAVEVALKATHQYWRNKGERRPLVLALEGAYHGDTFGAMALGRSSGFFGAFEELFFQVATLPVPQVWWGRDAREAEEQSLQQALALLEARGNEVSALIVEPLVQGASGMRFYSVEFLEALCDAVQERSIPVIFDEVMTGFHRLGPLFAYQQTRVLPDAVCLSKGLTGGVLPMGATLFQGKIFEAFLGERFSQALAHGHSYTGNPVGCAAGLASMELLGAIDLPAKLERIHRALEAGMRRLEASGGVERLRLRGCVAAFDLVGVRGGYDGGGARPLARHAQEKGVIVRPLGNTVYLIPPYCVTEEEIGRVFEVLEGGLAAVG